MAGIQQERYELTQLYRIRHSSAHIMAQAVLEMFPIDLKMAKISGRGSNIGWNRNIRACWSRFTKPGSSIPLVKEGDLQLARSVLGRNTWPRRRK